MRFTLSVLAQRSARHDWRGGLGLLAGALLCSALLTGAFATGRGIRENLAERMRARLAGVTHVTYSGDRYFRADLHARAKTGSEAAGGSHLLLPGSIATAAGTKRLNGIQVFGWQSNRLHQVSFPRDGVVINRALARDSGLAVGDEVVLRVANPGVLPREAVFSTEEDQTVAVRGKVSGILDQGIAPFSLRADLGETHNAFVPLDTLQTALQLPGQANLLLHQGPAPERAWVPADFGLAVVTNGPDRAELITSRIFLPADVEAAADKTGAVTAKIFTYFATALKSGTNATPYSTVCALEEFGAANPLLPADLKPGQTVINEWLAADLGAKPGDTLTVEYLTMGPQRTFRKAEKAFTIHSVVRMEGLAADRTLMPEFPGMADAENCRDWKAGLPVDFGRVRGQDEEYWDKHKGTPKAFIRLEDGRALWGNAFGSLTAIRFDTTRMATDRIAATLVAGLEPERFGLGWIPVQEQAARAIAQGMDFAGLFAGMSFFLIIACLALAGMFAAWQIGERHAQIALLRSVGYTPRRVRGLLLRESLLFIAAGALLGPALGWLYADVLCARIGGQWSGAVQGLGGRITPSGGLVEGLLGTLVIMALASWFRLRRATRGPVRDLLRPPPEATRAAAGKLALLTFVLAALGAVALAFGAREASAAQQPGFLFGAGALALVAGLALLRASLLRAGGGLASLADLARSNLRRSESRGVVTAGVLAAGLFMVGSAGAFRQDAGRDADKPAGGTGGFAWVLDATVPVLPNLNEPRVQEELGLEQLGLKVAAFRVQAGDEASCLNLMRAQKPRLLGVDPAALAGRFSFVFGPKEGDPWQALNQTLPDGEIPAIADQNSLMWAMHKKPGDVIEITAEDGSTARLRIVAAVNNTLLQGSLIVSDASFRALHPTTSGHRWFLADAAGADARAKLERGLRESGVQVTPAVERLARFHAVQNTYIDIFQVLGGLGVALGAAGLAAVTLRNLSRRRRELAVLQAQGFTSARLRRLAWLEHGLLLAAGTGIGVVAALFSIGPAGFAGAARLVVPAALLLAIGLIGVAWAVRRAIGGELISRLREEG